MNQIVCLGTSYVQKKLEDSLLSYKNIKFVDSADVNNEAPVLYLYFGDTEADKKFDSPRCDLKSLAEKCIILPVIKDPSKFRDYIPDALETVNAIIIPSEKYIYCLTNRILEFFCLIEINRKVFISYKRSDCAILAMQLYDALIKAHFIPFLDCYSIESGVNFQEYLLHELADSAVFLFLNTPNYDLSEFTMIELEVANRVQIGIVEVRDKRAKHFKEADFAKEFVLTDAKDENQVYDNQIIQEIVSLVGQSRAELYSFKKKALLDQIERTGKIDTVSDNGIICFSENNKRYYPIVHMPRSTDFEKAENAINASGGKNCQKFIVYNGLYYRKDIKNHLVWLDRLLPVKLLDTNE